MAVIICRASEKQVQGCNLVPDAGKCGVTFVIIDFVFQFHHTFLGWVKSSFVVATLHIDVAFHGEAEKVEASVMCVMWVFSSDSFSPRCSPQKSTRFRFQCLCAFLLCHSRRQRNHLHSGIKGIAFFSFSSFILLVVVQPGVFLVHPFIYLMKINIS